MRKELERLKNARILILGFGREGQSTLSFLRKYFPNKEIAVVDQNKVDIKDRQVKTFFGEGYLKSIYDYDVVFKSPGVPNKIGEIKEARAKGIEITSQTKLFFDLCEGEIVGITGTKGKSTTTTLIYEILQEAGIDSVILGNMGKPCLDYFDESFGKGKIFVFEMSSHQLSDLHKSPHIAVFLNIFREHLDYYESFEDYFNAKANITKFQKESDYFIYNANQKLISELAKKTKAKCFGFSKWWPEFEKIVSKKDTPLLGEHNLNNVIAAILVAKSLRIPFEKTSSAIKNFRPLEHRLDKIGTYRGVTFYDDTLATIPEATIAAINSLRRKIGTVILGGSERDQDFVELAKVILDEKIQNVVFFPTTGERIWKEIKVVARKGELPKHFFVDSMKDAVKKCFENTEKGKICLLSSASPSFSLFKDYQDKSEQFVKEIKAYGE